MPITNSVLIKGHIPIERFFHNIFSL